MTLPEIRQSHPASCHCGAVQFTVTLVPEGLATARRCDCSFCRRRGAIAVTAPLDGVNILTGQDKLTLRAAPFLRGLRNLHLPPPPVEPH